MLLASSGSHKTPINASIRYPPCWAQIAAYALGHISDILLSYWGHMSVTSRERLEVAI